MSIHAWDDVLLTGEPVLPVLQTPARTTSSETVARRTIRTQAGTGIDPNETAQIEGGR